MRPAALFKILLKIRARQPAFLIAVPCFYKVYERKENKYIINIYFIIHINLLPLLFSYTLKTMFFFVYINHVRNGSWDSESN